MERLIPIMNKIQDSMAIVQQGQFLLDLPQIVMVGGQSAGKSSILESLVGKSFLPTGSGVVTRRPLTLRLCNTRLEGSDREWGEFSHAPGQQFDDFDEIRNEIVRETERVCGVKQVISSSPIVLKIFSPNVIDLTLIDLPGITRVPIGDQPPDIERQIRELVMQYVKNPRCIILAVVAGNADLATADGLSVAREVDAEGIRTIGVVTKLDLAQGTDMLSVLEGRIYPLRHGFLGVMCRSVKDVSEKRQLKDHQHVEDQFFRTSPVFKSVSQRCGVANLARFLNQFLMGHIRDALPELKNRVVQMIEEQNAELEGYGASVSLKPIEQGPFLLGIFTKFANRFGDAIEGKVTAENSSPGQLVGRARIDFIFRDVFARTVREFDVYSGLSDDEIRVAIRNASGPRATLFVPEAAFELLVKKQIAKIETPSLQCAQLVFEELERVVSMSELVEFKRFVKLREQVLSIVRTILRDCLEPAQQMIRNLIHVELAYINTSHPDFIGSAGAMRSAAGRQREQAVAANPQVQPSPGGTPPDSATAASLSAPPASGSAPGGEGTEQNPQASSGFFSNLNIFRRQPVRESGEGTPNTPGGPPPHLLMQQPVGAPAAAAAASSLQPADVAALQRASSSASSGTSAGLRLPPIPQTIRPATTPASSRERLEVDIIKSLLENYMAIVKKNVADSVPKAVMHFMVTRAKDSIQHECVSRLYKQDLFSILLEEAPGMQGRRARCQERLQALNKVVEVFAEVRNTDPLA